MLFPEGWRRVEVTQRDPLVVRKLVDEDYAHKDRIVLVMDNLNTHRPSSLYEAFDPAEARRIAERLEIHYTPQARQLAEHGGDRVGCAVAAVPGPPDSRPRDIGAGDRGLAGPAEPGRDTSGLALHHPGRPH